jgi:predicted transcriptional regulator
VIMSLTAVPIGLTFLSFVVNSSDVVAFFHFVTYFFFPCLQAVVDVVLLTARTAFHLPCCLSLRRPA